MFFWILYKVSFLVMLCHLLPINISVTLLHMLCPQFCLLVISWMHWYLLNCLYLLNCSSYAHNCLWFVPILEAGSCTSSGNNPPPWSLPAISQTVHMALGGLPPTHSLSNSYHPSSTWSTVTYMYIDTDRSHLSNRFKISNEFLKPSSLLSPLCTQVWIGGIWYSSLRREMLCFTREGDFE